MATEIKMSFDELNEQINRLNDRANMLRPYTTKLWTNPVDKIAPMNSDFTEKVNDSIKHMKTDKKLDIMKVIDAYIKSARAMSALFIELDEKLKLDSVKSPSNLGSMPIGK